MTLNWQNLMGVDLKPKGEVNDEVGDKEKYEFMIKGAKCMIEQNDLNDFIYQLVDFLKSLKLPMPVKIGLFEEEDTIALAPMQGGLVIQNYYNGIQNQRLPYEIGIKVFENQQLALDTLTLIADELTKVSNIPSQNESYEFLNIQISSKPFFRGQDVDGFFFYRLEIEVDLNVK